MNKTNQEMIQEYNELSKKMKELENQDRLQERNSYVPRIQDLSEVIDWGYSMGEAIERRTGRGWEEDVIQKIEGAKIFFRTVILPPQLIRRPIKNKKQEIEKEWEQISLF